ncbi:MAG: MazG nucleotide pyrophosphohydrolase domain-containing protein [Promethearchaeota archaeon]
MINENFLKEAQDIVDKWIRDHGGYWPPLSMTCAIMEELGEIAREINAIEGYKPKKLRILDSNLGEELADLLFSVICIGNYFEIDLGKEFNNIIKKYSRRDSNRFK